jgi:hypothetical protein
MRSNRPVLDTITASFALAACATGGVIAPETERTVITAPELATSGAAHVRDAVQRLRPEFLRVRGPSSILNTVATGPAVFVDGALLGAVDVLGDIPVGDLARIKYHAAWDATTRFGDGYPHGVIELITKRGGQ